MYIFVGYAFGIVDIGYLINLIKADEVRLFENLICTVLLQRGSITAHIHAITHPYAILHLQAKKITYFLTEQMNLFIYIYIYVIA
jgi:hypothetical protein